MSNDKYEGLRWVRALTPIHIPRKLVEQIKDRDYSVERFYNYLSKMCLNTESSGFSLNPLCQLYLMIDQNNLVKGFLWFEIDALANDLIVQVFSVDKSMWCKGKALKMADELIKSFVKDKGISRVFWITKYPKHFERYGYKISRHTLMEWENGKECDGKNEEGEGHRHVGPGSEGLLQQVDQGSGGAIECGSGGLSAAV